MTNQKNPIYILHLSDIHCEKILEANRYFTQLATDLTQNLNVKKINYLVISGDIANYSTEIEYDAAFRLVDKLIRRYKISQDRVVIVPGNHDLNWEISKKSYILKDREDCEANELKQGCYIEVSDDVVRIRNDEEYKNRFIYFNNFFYEKIHNKPYPLDYDRQAILYLSPEDKILFLALNSCWEIDYKFPDRASINPNAISNALDQILMGEEDYDDWLKIAVWHHPVTSAESMKNVAFLEQLVTNGFQIGMHGHIHEAKDENFQYDTQRGLRIIAAGTFGAPAKEQVTGIPLQYNLLALKPEMGELTVETRKKEKTDGAWSADARWGDKNNPVPRYTISLRYSLHKEVSHNLSTSKATSDKNASITTPQATEEDQESSRCTILILASSPKDEARLRLDKEVREITEGLQLAKQRDRFVIEQRWATRPQDLRLALLDLNPEIVHFCGHGTGDDGLVLENDAGEAHIVSTDALARLFRQFSDQVKCVVLNACYSEVQAEAISEHIECVIGMNNSVSDKAAIKFARGFYEALVRERTIEDSLEFGCNAIELENLPEHQIPILKKNII
ncbi:metallophosphoesterase [Spirulina sp. 06S082]|uniref:metallophosphoesterase n=1 Tax=Spirulina sp. 06S082 TaxID=3110248 RepID=UPI002B1FC9CA|nr:metallophosphoesterase [Spirulina sp. 06S082]MEA5470695.1 metallophosphoesterase [Spirulina sp. 06S082]